MVTGLSGRDGADLKPSCCWTPRGAYASPFWLPVPAEARALNDRLQNVCRERLLHAGPSDCGKSVKPQSLCLMGFQMAEGEGFEPPRVGRSAPSSGGLIPRIARAKDCSRTDILPQRSLPPLPPGGRSVPPPLPPTLVGSFTICHDAATAQ